MIRPWIDVGSVASLTLARLERHFGAQELGKLTRPGNFFDFTRYRPTMRLVEGKRELTVPNSIINYAQPPSGPDVVFFHLLEPHAFGEDYTDSVLEVFKFLGVKRYCRLGAMYDAVPHTRPVRVSGDIGGISLRMPSTRLHRRRSTYQGPTTIMNLVSDGVPKLNMNIDTISLMVHLPQYVQLEEDYAGVASLLEVLASIYDLPPDLVPTSRGQRQYRELDKAVEGNQELKGLIKRMEAQYDSEEATRQEDAPPPPPLSPEVERFLHEMDQRFGGSGQPEPKSE
jgi:hypothetical protein